MSVNAPLTLTAERRLSVDPRGWSGLPGADAHGKLDAGRVLAAQRWAARPQADQMRIDIVDADFGNAVHCAGLIDVLDSYARDPVGGTEPLTATVRERLVPALRDHPTAVVLLAIAQGRPVGIAVCFLGFSTFRARPLLNIHDLAVLPECRRKGVGRGLLAAAEDRARRRGCCRLTLEVQESNGRAADLYRSFGFSDLVIGDSSPTRFLVKPLDEPSGRQR